MPSDTQQLDLFDESPASVRAVDWGRLPAEHPLSYPGALPAGLYLGTSSWSFPGWDQLLYDGSYTEQRLAESGLAAYARSPLFRCVSLDKSYYRPPTQQEFVRLAGQVDDDFRFVVKAPRDLLLPRPESGFEMDPLTRLFLKPASHGLGSKLGVVLLQFPPGSYRAIGSPQGFTQHLAALFRALPRELSYSLEVRDTELLTPSLVQAMRDTSVSLCASIHPNLPSLEQQLLAVPPTPETPLVFRWNLRPSFRYQEAREDFRPFNQLKSPDPDRRNRLAHLIARALQAGRTVYVTVNNKAEGCAPLSLRTLLEELSSKS